MLGMSMLLFLNVLWLRKVSLQGIAGSIFNYPFATAFKVTDSYVGLAFKVFIGEPQNLFTDKQ